MAGPVQRGHATATMVLGICELLCGILIIILAIVASSKASVGAGLSPWWAGVVVSRFYFIVFIWMRAASEKVRSGIPSSKMTIC